MLEKLLSTKDYLVFYRDGQVGIVKWGWPINDNETKYSSLNKQQARFLIAQLGESSAMRIWSASR